MPNRLCPGEMAISRVPVRAVALVAYSEMRRPRVSERCPKNSEPRGRAMKPTASTMSDCRKAVVAFPAAKKDAAKKGAKVL